jgi:hypothetical protein
LPLWHRDERLARGTSHWSPRNEQALTEAALHCPRPPFSDYAMPVEPPKGV